MVNARPKIGNGAPMHGDNPSTRCDLTSGENMIAYRTILVVLAATLLSGVAGCASTTGGQNTAAHSTPQRHKVVFQVSDPDPKKWNLALNNAKNVQQDLGVANVDVEIVAYGPGIGMVKMGSVTGNRIGEAMAAGVKVVACENTMRNMKLSKADMLPKLGYVPAGVVELMERQQQGYSYIRP